MTGGPSGLEIAIIGMAGRFPGAATVEEFWAAVCGGSSAVREFSDEQVAAAGVPEQVRRRPGYVPAGAELADVEYFDAGFFGYSPRDAALLDPQQRLFLENAWHALEDAGHGGPPGDEVVGVFAACSLSTYLLRHLLGNPAVPGGLSPLELVLGNDKDTLASRVAYHLDLTGPAISVQTACSASLVAVHLAGQALLSRDCDIALAGGVSVRLPQHEGYQHHEGSILSPSGHCRPFDAAADGVVGGNGVAAVVLRRLADAVRDGDTVHAVIKGSAVNNDGAAKVGFTAPSVTGQANVVRAAHQLSDVEASSIGYVEAHGTGTALGDPVELAALRAAFGHHAGAPVALGSVKALVGHLDAAAGVTGLIKAALAVEHGVIPPNPYFRAPNPESGPTDGRFFVNRDRLSWPPGPSPRRAGVSGFGMGGTNAHVVLEQPPQGAPPSPGRPWQLLVLSARTERALAESAARLAGSLTTSGAPELADVAHTLRVGRRALEHRTVLVSPDREHAARSLSGEGPAWTARVPAQRPNIVFLFPGQGSQYAGMAAQLYRHEPVFRDRIDECAELLVEHLGTDVRQVLHPTDAAERLLATTRVTQPALFAVEYALAALWRHWGIAPAAMLGHSVGEYVAACLAGVMSLPAALALVAARGELMQALPGGAMLAVPLPAAAVGELLARWPRLSLAASNAPTMSTVAGPEDEIGALAAELTAKGLRVRRLRTSHAFHSAMVEPMLAPFAERVAATTLSAPSVPFASNVTGEWITAAEATDPGYWARHAREAVRFSQGLRTVLGNGPTLLVEVGPGNSLSTLARQHDLTGAGHQVFASLRHALADQADLEVMLAGLGRLWLGGADADLAAVTGDEPRRRVPLPAYPFARERHWVEPPGGRAASPATAVDPAAAPVPAPVERPESGLSVVTGVWQELLGITGIGPDDDFFELGGHSLLAVQILARISDAIGVTLPAGAMFESPTPRRLAERAERLLAEARAEPQADPDSELTRMLAEIRQMSPDQLRAELERERRPDMEETSRS